MTIYVTRLGGRDEDADNGLSLTNDGMPRVHDFASALDTWWICQNRMNVTVAEAALAFNTTTDVIREAINEHYWMNIAGIGDDAVIEMDGE